MKSHFTLNIDITRLYNMEYTKTFFELKSLFSSTCDEINIPDSGNKICNVRFKSDVPSSEFLNPTDSLVDENHVFTYPVFTPENTDSKKVILLLHGLNERSWVKYLVWAYYLSKFTNSYVILFPISFHINRSPAAWSDPRSMMPFMKSRNENLGEINKSSFANIALSNRLFEDPMRFFNSGYQTSKDITKLLLSIKKGVHPIIPRTNEINIFAYSIGAFLAEIMLMGNPENIFTRSKLFIFCGGSVFSNMQGSSKLIMDSLAFKRVYNYYLNDFEKGITGQSQLVDFLRFNKLGMAFRSMIDLERLKTFREKIFMKLRNQIQSITLLQDSVIPPEGVLATLNNTYRSNMAEIWDFPYTYSHENPFPILDFPQRKKVDTSFELLFSKATAFLG
jgi:Family of unknown function (DUF6051)